MIVDLPSGMKVKIKWTHYMDDSAPKGTVCILWKVDEDKETTIGTGETNLHEGDQYCRAIGRRLSLERAIKNNVLYHFDKNDRRKIWFEVMRLTKGTWDNSL